MSYRSRLARALWIEILRDGLNRKTVKSRLARALWIEICNRMPCQRGGGCRGSREPCGLKSVVDVELINKSCRGSREPCGLKFWLHLLFHLWFWSRLARALWIEIFMAVSTMASASRRGSREPCGLKFLRTCTIGGRSNVEARESLVD